MVLSNHNICSDNSNNFLSFDKCTLIVEDNSCVNIALPTNRVTFNNGNTGISHYGSIHHIYVTLGLKVFSVEVYSGIW